MSAGGECKMKTVLHSFVYGLDFLREQVRDVDAPGMVAQPNGIMNHPAWVIGHLTYVCQLLGSTIGVPSWLPDDWTRRYGTGSVPVGDPSSYETKEKVLAMLADAQSRLIRRVEQLSDSQLDAPFPDPSYAPVFPSIRHALTQVLIGHTSYHIGQVAMWRKAMGLPRMTRSFE